MNRRTFLTAATVAGASALVAPIASAAVPARRDASGNRIKLGIDNFAVRAWGWKGRELVDYAAGLKLDTLFITTAACDLTDAELADIAAVATSAGLSAIIATNTTLSRDGLKSPHAGEKGGLSGTPLFEKSTRILARLAGLTDLPLVGVGGISSAEDAYAKILAGASAVQLYTALVYGGISLADEITRGLDRLLARDGYANVAEAVGKGRAKWT